MNPHFDAGELGVQKPLNLPSWSMISSQNNARAVSVTGTLGWPSNGDCYPWRCQWRQASAWIALCVGTSYLAPQERGLRAAAHIGVKGISIQQ